MPFAPVYLLTPVIVGDLLRIEAARKGMETVVASAAVLAGLRKTARLLSSHYSTQIEGNRLTLAQAEQVVTTQRAKTRDEKEVLGYFAALDCVAALVEAGSPVRQSDIKLLHAHVMGGGATRKRGTPYRDGQNVIRESASGSIVYLPPQAHDVAALMEEMIEWLGVSLDALPVPVVAAIAHYQVATIHPYFDGNGRTARLLATLVMHKGGYGLQGIYTLDEHYAADLASYYSALDVGLSHNYYEGRASADITDWIAYFCRGAADATERISGHAQTAGTSSATAFRNADARQRRVLQLFEARDWIVSSDIATLLGVRPRTARSLCQRWVAEGFLRVVDPARKSRKYALAGR